MTYQFIDAIKDHIVKSAPGNEKATRVAIALWELDEEACSPFQSAVFSVCDQIRKDIAAHAKEL